MLKERHTHRVCSNIVSIARDLQLTEGEILLAETIALYHDVGRFSQYARYKTFRDAISVNHGLLGARVLTEAKVLSHLPPDEQELIIVGVKFHNAFALPNIKDLQPFLLLKLIRDADKLDIWRVFIEHYDGLDEHKASAVGLGLPVTYEYTNDVRACIYKKQMVSLSNLKTLNDFKLLQLSWIFDLNFKTSFELLLERDYINRYVLHLPQTEEIPNAMTCLRKFVNEKLKNV
ncbi:MAG: HD domain-containing protein [Dissulfurispiraceae bacterium]